MNMKECLFFPFLLAEDEKNDIISEVECVALILCYSTHPAVSALIMGWILLKLWMAVIRNSAEEHSDVLW